MKLPDRENWITKTGKVKVYLCQQPNGDVFLHAHFHRRNLPMPSHFKVLAAMDVDVSLTGDAGHDPDRAYPSGV